MTLSNNICLNSANIGCNSNSNCFSNLCGTTGFVLNYYDFSKPEIVGSKKISIKTLPGISGISQVKKMVASSINSLDLILLLDQEQGIYQCTFDHESGTVYQPWTQGLPLVTDNGVIVDFAFNGSEYLVAFQNQNSYLLYSGLSLSDLSPFNYVTGGSFSLPPGVQYAYGMPITNVNYVDISSAGDVLIINDQATYLKKTSDLSFSFYQTSNNIVLGTGSTGLARFYSSESSTPPYLNLAYYYPNSLRIFFSGDNEQLMVPARYIDATEEIVDFSISSSDYLICLNGSGEVYGLVKNHCTLLPFNTDQNSRVLAVQGTFYIFTIGSCENT
jgi:hypothetical protein